MSEKIDVPLQEFTFDHHEFMDLDVERWVFERYEKYSPIQYTFVGDRKDPLAKRVVVIRFYGLLREVADMLEIACKPREGREL
jgi:hypothetical protein